VGVSEFAARLGPRLEMLSRLLAGGGYRAQPLRLVESVRAGKRRDRGIPTVCDRIAQRAFLAVAGHRLDDSRPEVSFAYHRGRSWVDALVRAARYREAGLRWVFRTDISDFFASLEHRIVTDVVAEVVSDPQAVELVTQWAAAPVLTADGVRQRPRGVPEGAPISPMLANLYLRGFDARVHRGHGQLVRFADDIALFCADLESATAGGTEIAEVLSALGLRLNPAKTCITTFDAGFTMLGWQFRGDHGQPVQDTPEWTHPLSGSRAAGGVR
jgi:RNA-directed DNA polymerase